MNTDNFQAYGSNIIVRVDRAAQLKKAFISKFIQVPPEYEYMLYNNQYGEIVSIGPNANREEIQLGRTALFHHRIESEERTLLHVFENGDQLRWVPTHGDQNSYQYYGTIDKEGIIYPAKEYIFCKPAESDDDGYEDFEAKDSSIGSGMKMKIKQEGLLFLAKTFHKKEEEDKIFQDLRIALTPPEETWLMAGDKIKIEAWAMYPLSFLQHDFQLVLRQFVIAKIT